MLITERHTAHVGRRAPLAHHARGEDAPVGHHLRDAVEEGCCLVPIGQEGFAIHRQVQQHHTGAALFENRGNRFARFRGRSGKADERGRDVELVERAGHAVLSADGRHVEVQLRSQRAEQGCRGLAPALGLIVQPLEILLHGKPCGEGLRADHGKLCQGFRNRIGRAVEGAPAAQRRDEAIAHRGGGVCLALKHRDARAHRVLRRELVFASVWHQHCARADGGVKPLHQPLLRADGQAGKVIPQRLRLRLPGELGRNGGAVILFRVDRGDLCLRVLGDAIGIEKCTAQGDDLVAAPFHGKIRLVFDDGHRGCLQVFLCSERRERFHVLRRKHDRHALLRFGDGELCAVKAVVFLRDGVQIDIEAVRQFADGDAYAARAEVVAALDHARRVMVAEQALELALGRRIALLDLRTAGLDGRGIVRLGGTGCAAAAVAARAAAEQDDHVARLGALAADIFFRGGADDRADLHALRSVALVI